MSGGVRAMSTYSAESSHDYVIVGAGSAGELIRYVYFYLKMNFYVLHSVCILIFSSPM